MKICREPWTEGEECIRTKGHMGGHTFVDPRFISEMGTKPVSSDPLEPIKDCQYCEGPRVKIRARRPDGYDRIACPNCLARRCTHPKKAECGIGGHCTLCGEVNPVWSG